MTDAKTEAKRKIGEFEKRTEHPNVWAAIHRREVAEGLKMRVDNPGLIDQAGSSLCGAAALIYEVAQDSPVKYVEFVINLFEKGRASIGSLDVEPDVDLRQYKPSRNIAPADWIALASIRDSTNWFLDYQSEKDEAAGVTFPSSLAGWFRRAGYSSIHNETNLFFCKGAKNAHNANRLLAKGYKVMLFINSDMLDKVEHDRSGKTIKIITTHNNKSFCPNHWVVLQSQINFTPSVSFSIYTWGVEYMPVPLTGTLTKEHFLNNYYGYVACKY